MLETTWIGIVFNHHFHLFRIIPTPLKMYELRASEFFLILHPILSFPEKEYSFFIIRDSLKTKVKYTERRIRIIVQIARNCLKPARDCASFLGGPNEIINGFKEWTENNYRRQNGVSIREVSLVDKLGFKLMFWISQLEPIFRFRNSEGLELFVTPKIILSFI